MKHYTRRSKRISKRQHRLEQYRRRDRLHAGRQAAWQSRGALNGEARRAALAADTAFFLYGLTLRPTKAQSVVLESKELYRKRNGGSLAGWALYRWFYRG